jgi:23S rRNA-/tRNA-specific pseudouridylate synthase
MHPPNGSLHAAKQGQSQKVLLRSAVSKFCRRLSRALLVRAEPVTGRTHQLRVHLSEYGMPIIGDRTYGGEPAERLMLHARRLNFVAPMAKM